MRNLTAFLIVLIAALATGCGGSGSSVTASSGNNNNNDGNNNAVVIEAPGAATGAMTKGSVIVDGIHFTAATGATIRIDDNPGPESDLRDGMEVRVKGTVADDGVNGHFEKVETEPEVRGLITVKGIDDLTVNAQIVIVDDKTVFEDRVAGVFSPLTFADLLVANNVEVHGVRDDLGRIRATRVERRDDSPLDEIKGTISTAPDGATFQISSALLGTVTVNYSAATPILPAGATLNLGDPVEVHGPFSAGVITATRIDREDLEDNEFEPGENHKIRAEGFVSGFTTLPGDFKVDGRNVRTTATTIFMNGNAIDFDNGIKVEAEGHVVQGVLVAVKIKFKRAVVRLQGDATGNSATSITMFGKTINIHALLTRLHNVDLATIVGGSARLEVRAHLDSNGVIVPTRVDPAGTGDFIQGPVSAKDATAKTLVLMSGGNTVNADLAGVLEINFRDAANNPIGSAAFFATANPATASGVPPATVVKARGVFNPATNTIVATQVEIEN